MMRSYSLSRICSTIPIVSGNSCWNGTSSRFLHRNLSSDDEKLYRCMNTPRDSCFPRGKLPPSCWRRARETAVGPDANPKLYHGRGRDYHHWQIWPKRLQGSPSQDDIIRYYINILSQVLPSQEQAIEKIYSVATRQYYAFGANVSDDIANKIDNLPYVCYVIPDTYVDPIAKRYPWDPFINGQPLPYDPKFYPIGIKITEADERMAERRRSYPTDVKPNYRFDVKPEKPERSCHIPEGLDFEHWRIFTEPMTGTPTKDEIIQYYIQILAQVLGSEEEAMKKIYSVATRQYYAFGAIVSFEIARMMQGLTNVNCVFPDLYLNPLEKRYSWDPFIDGQALEYDPKYYPKSSYIYRVDDSTIKDLPYNMGKQRIIGC